MSVFPLQWHKQPAQTMPDSVTSSSDSLMSTDRLKADNSGCDSPSSDVTHAMSVFWVDTVTYLDRALGL